MKNIFITVFLAFIALSAKGQTIDIDNQTRSQICVEIWVVSGGCPGTPTLFNTVCINPFTTNPTISLPADAVGVLVESAGEIATRTSFGDPCYASRNNGSWISTVFVPSVPTWGTFAGGSAANVVVWD